MYQNQAQNPLVLVDLDLMIDSLLLFTAFLLLLVCFYGEQYYIELCCTYSLYHLPLFIVCR